MTTPRTVRQFREFVVRPALFQLGLPGGAAAENLVVGTAVFESGLDHFDQWLGPDDHELGPAFGVYQIEAATACDVWINFLAFREDLAEEVKAFCAPWPTLEHQLVTNLGYATAMCRLIYWRAKEKLPAADDIEGLGRYYKNHYNSSVGKGHPAMWAAKYRSLCA